MLFLNGRYVLQPARTYRTMVRMSDRLFRACWRDYRRMSIDAPRCDADVVAWLDLIATEKVNNSRSTFYIHG